MIWIKKGLGFVALFIGCALIAWFIYNLFSPTSEFKRSYRGGFLLILPIVFITYGWKWIRYEGRGIEQTPIDFKCQELVESVAHAQKTLPYFVEEVKKNIDGAFIKFALTTAQGNLEHIWAYVHSYQNGQFNVSLANIPFDKKQSADGRRDVSSAEVQDWQIMQRDGKIKGAYSLIALFRYRESLGQKLTPRMAKQKAQLLDVSSV